MGTAYRLAWLTAALLLPQGAKAMLVTPEEASRPEAVPSVRGLFPGPRVTIASPSVADLARPLVAPFRLMVSFEPRNGATISAADVKLVYLKTPQVNLTPRILSSLSASGIDLQNVHLPPGRHTFQVTVADSDGHLGNKTFTLLVAK